MDVSVRSRQICDIQCTVTICHLDLVNLLHTGYRGIAYPERKITGCGGIFQLRDSLEYFIADTRIVRYLLCPDRTFKAYHKVIDLIIHCTGKGLLRVAPFSGSYFQLVISQCQTHPVDTVRICFLYLVIQTHPGCHIIDDTTGSLSRPDFDPERILHHRQCILIIDVLTCPCISYYQFHLVFRVVIDRIHFSRCINLVIFTVTETHCDIDRVCTFL